MSFFKNFFTPRPSTSGRFYQFAMKCNPCGEILHGQVNISNDPSLDFDENGKPYYLCRKVVVGSGSYYQQIEIVFKFNELRGLIDRQITGGEFVNS